MITNAEMDKGLDELAGFMGKQMDKLKAINKKMELTITQEAIIYDLLEKLLIKNRKAALDNKYEFTYCFLSGVQVIAIQTYLDRKPIQLAE